MDRKKFCWNICKDNMLLIYGLLQVILLAMLRKYYLLTVYQTVAAYLFVCLCGVIVLKFVRNKAVQNIYLLMWSSFHGIIILGFLTQGTFYLTLTQINKVQIVNLFLGFLLYWIFYLISGKGQTAVAVGNLVIAVMGITNHYLMRFRGAPFQISDLKAAKTAGNVFLNYDYMPDLYMLFTVIDLFVWYKLIKQEYQKRELKKRQIPDAIVTVAAVFACIPLVNGTYQKIYSETGQFSKDSYLAELLADAEGKIESYPEGYSAENAKKILQDFNSQALQKQEMVSTAKKMPNIVVIMNEAFSDLRVLGEIETDQPFLEYWDSLEENCIKGWANVSVFGGTTANSEYEFLSSDATALYQNPVIPYNNYFEQTDVYQSMVSVLIDQGYETTAFHPYLSSGWNRTQVYRAMQFDHIIFSEDLEQPLDTMRLYTSDEGDYTYIRQYFDQKEKNTPQFFFNVTMQNHSGYTYDGDNFKTTVHLRGDAAGKFPQAEQYLSLIRESDKALKGLLEYFENYEEPVVVVMFGDHQPADYITNVVDTGKVMDEGDDSISSIGTGSDRKERYIVPFVMWANYDIDESQGEETSANYLAVRLLKAAGLPLTDFQSYLSDLEQEVPFVSAHVLKENQETESSTDTADNLLKVYKKLLYNDLFDTKHRLENFFSY